MSEKIEGQEGQEGPEGAELEGQEGAESQEHEKFIPRQRFDDVYGKYKGYKDLGTPDDFRAYRQLGDAKDVQARLDRLAKYEQALEQHRNNAGRTPEQETTEKIRQQLYEVVPGLKNLNVIEQLQQERMSANIEKASSYLADKLKAEGLDLPKELAGEVEDLLASRMSNEEKMMLVKGNMTGIDRVLKENITKGLLGRIKTASIPPPATPPARHPQGSSVPKKGGSLKNFADADNIAWERFSNS